MMTDSVKFTRTSWGQWFKYCRHPDRHEDYKEHTCYLSGEVLSEYANLKGTVANKADADKVVAMFDGCAAPRLDDDGTYTVMITADLRFLQFLTTLDLLIHKSGNVISPAIIDKVKALFAPHNPDVKRFQIKDQKLVV